MDRCQRLGCIILLLLLFSVENRGWLSDYFDTKNENLPYKVKAIELLQLCTSNINVQEWESGIRKRNMTNSMCSEVDKIRKCVYESYQDAVSMYIKLLVEDGTNLCKDVSSEICVINWILPSLILISIGLTFIFVGIIYEKRIIFPTTHTVPTECCDHDLVEYLDCDTSIIEFPLKQDTTAVL